MCGIAGIVGLKDDLWIDRSLLHAMCRTIVHRGPDDEGIFVRDGAGLGMRRLSIIDLAGGHQPVFNEDGTCWTVFNGEIYNYQEIRRELESRGHRFTSQTDTEVIVHLYEDLGADCVHKLRGMFALAVYDQRRRKLLLARDRLGKKPLYYAVSGERIYFASEIKAILAAAPELAKINSQALLQYFYFGYIPDPLTAFSPVRKLSPGHLLEFHDGDARVSKYWDLPEFGTYSPSSEEECLEQLEERLREAVRIRMIADVPLGAWLSGGTDSSTVVALMAQSSSRPVKTFSIGFKAADFDETAYARIVADKFGTDHHDFVLEPNVVETVESLSRTLEEPFGDSSMLPTYYVSRMARQFVTVVLSGDGGDELFAGYDRYRIHLHERARLNMPGWLGQLYRDQIFPNLRSVRGANLAYSLSLDWADRYLDAISLEPYQRLFPAITQEFITYASRPVTPRSIFQQYIDSAPAQTPLERVLYLDAKTYLPGDILTKVDRMSMLASLEARSPMLDHHFVEWVTSLTSDWKMHQGEQKHILKKLAARVGVPNEVLHRPKQGFALPLLHWLRGELKELVYSLLLDRGTLMRGYFDSDGTQQLCNAFFSGRTDDHLILWRLMMFELWQRNFVESLPVTSKPHSTQSIPLQETA